MMIMIAKQMLDIISGLKYILATRILFGGFFVQS